jgi:hypothetical protein
MNSNVGKPAQDTANDSSAKLPSSNGSYPKPKSLQPLRPFETDHSNIPPIEPISPERYTGEPIFKEMHGPCDGFMSCNEQSRYASGRGDHGNDQYQSDGSDWSDRSNGSRLGLGIEQWWRRKTQEASRIEEAHAQRLGWGSNAPGGCPSFRSHLKTVVL